MISRAILNFIIALAISGALGCSKDSTPNQVHESALKVKSIPENESTSSEEKIFFDLSEITESDLAKTIPSEIFKKIITPLSKNILNLKFLDSKKISTSEKSFAMLRVLNKAILKIHFTAKDNVNEQKILAAYEQILFSGCDANLTSCEKISFFAHDPQSSEVAGLIAANKKDSHTFFTQILVAFELANRGEHSGLNQLYLSHFAGLHTELVNIKQKSPNLYNHHISILHLLIQNGSVDQLKSLNSWNIDFSQSPELVPFGDDLKRIKVSNKIYEKDDLTPELKNAIASSQLMPASFSEIEKQLIADHSRMYKALKIEKIKSKNEYFYIIDQLFQGQLQLNEAMTIWNNSKQDIGQMTAIARAYNQVRFAKLIIDANQRIKTFFASPDQITNQKVQDAIRFSPNIALISESYQTHTKNVSSFIKLILSQQRLDLSTSPDVESLKNLDGLLSNIKYNIRLNISYPHMLLTAFYIVQREFSVQVRGHQELVNSVNLYKDIFNGRMNLWFDYGTDEPPSVDHSIQFSSVEILKAITAAIFNETLQSFSLSADQYFKFLIENLVSPYIYSNNKELPKMNESLNFIRQSFESPDWKHLLELCNALAHSGSVVREINFTELLISPTYGKNLEMFSKPSDEPTRETAGYNLFSSRLLKQLEEVRTVISPNLHAIRFLMDSYKDYLNEIGEQPSNKSLSESEAKLKQFEAQVQNYILTVQKYKDQNQKCLYPLVKYENETQIKIVEYEIEHLRQIHRDMKKLKIHPELTQTINQQNHFRTPLTTAQAKDYFNADSLNYSQFDFLMRIKDYYEFGIQTESAKKPPLDPNMRIDLPLNFHFDSIYNASRAFQILYRENEEEFVNSALQAALHQPDATALLLWFNFSSALTTITNNLLGVISLYRLNPLLTEAGIHQQVKLSDIVDFSRQQLDSLSLSKSEKEIFARIGQEDRFQRAYDSVEGVYFDHQTMTTLPFLNRSFEYLFANNLSEVILQSHQDATIDLNPDSKPTFVYAALITNAGLKRGSPAFETNHILDLDLKNYYSGLIKFEYDSAKDFEKLARLEFENDKSTQKLMNLDINLAIKFKSPPSYLSDYEITNLNGIMKNFKMKTGNYYNVEN